MAYDLVDWEQAPALARWWAMDANGHAYWHCQPDVAAFTDFWMPDQIEAPHFGFTGDWKKSLTERPA
ncbi:MAG: hypothetical protein WCY07_07280 [Pigmentiphaga sp.]